MKQLTKEFRVRPGETVDLKRRPTRVDPVYRSKQEYKQLLDEHVARLSAQQELLYASNRHALLIIWAVIGIVAGWLASVLVGGGGGLVRYLITGLIGAFVGGFVFQAAGWKLNLGNEWLDQIVIAAIGAIIVVIIARIVV